MQAIQTKYHGPTNTKGARISARSDGGRLTVGYDHALDAEGNHKAAARLLAEKLHWIGPGERYTDVQGGRLPGGTWAWILTP